MSADRALVVLQLAANRWWTGSADPVIQLSRGLRARGHRVMLGIIPGGPFEDKARDAGLAPLTALSLDARVHPARVVSDLARLRRVIRHERVDIIHSHHSHDHWLGWLSRDGAGLARTFHNARAVSGRWPSTALYRGSDAAIVVSERVDARCRDVGIASERRFLVEPVVAVDRFTTTRGAGADIRKEFGLETEPLIGCVARLAPNRGHKELIRGFALLLEEYPDARLLLVGKGEARAPLEAFVGELGLAHRVVFAGYRDGDLPAVLDALDAFVLMAAGSDDSCRAAIEAMAAGRVVVAPRVGALPRAIVDGATGILLDDDRPESVADALRRILRDPEQARGMGEAGRRRVMETFTPECHAAQTEAVYREVLARRGRN
jgi:glycosyltransferase involved in cell wall biosynthesis